MPNLILRFDMRSPDFGAEPRALYAAALEMAEWADAHGYAEIMLSEHHGQEDAYLPSPLTLAAAMAARTQRVRIRISALVLPLHDPLRVAEDVAVVDQLSGGRIELVLVGGFVPSEFEMFDRDLAARARRVAEGVATLKQAWTGEPFVHEGREVRVRPTPVQVPHPPLLLGGSSEPAARRAARIADGFVPIVPELYAVYEATCRELGKPAAPDRVLGPPFLHVCRDPDAAWSRITPHALHETNSYSRWYSEAGITGPYQPTLDADALRASGGYAVLTPEDCVSTLRTLGEDAWIFVHPLMGGLDPKLGWESMQLLDDEVLPALRG
jgi:alkanesulfonate monooxygenase SsuD/methylene tetrahydromethanopterin reductase-like flavin-dependent oxidoreductase (luciferase family)